MISPTQIRAARAMLGWSQIELAQRCGRAEPTVIAAEKGVADQRISTINAIERAFTDAGIEFLELDGVRLASSPARKD